ncbi:MAG: aspartyl/asparaginyl beta-hydroxylase domain-containing protein [Acidimicrobiia bacterium]
MQLWDRIVWCTNWVGERVLRGVNRLIARASVLPDQPFYDPKLFPWVEPIEAQWSTIRKELDAVLAHRDDLPNFQEISTDQLQITDDDRWKTFFLYGYGFRSDANCARCPETAKLVEAIPGMKTAMFSILSPHKHIPPHDGPFKGVVRYHLGLIVPEPAAQCTITVGGETAQWGEGASLVFDDTYVHEVHNDTDGTRVVLFVDVVRELRGVMRYVNLALVKAIGYSPFVQDAKHRHLEWERRYAALQGGLRNPT